MQKRRFGTPSHVASEIARRNKTCGIRNQGLARVQNRRFGAPRHVASEMARRNKTCGIRNRTPEIYAAFLNENYWMSILDVQIGYSDKIIGCPYWMSDWIFILDVILDTHIGSLQWGSACPNSVVSCYSIDSNQPNCGDAGSATARPSLEIIS